MERTIRCVAIDDEPLALEVIEKFCARIGGIEIKMFADSEKGLACVLEEEPDIVFLDIEMEICQDWRLPCVFRNRRASYSRLHI